MKDTFSNKTQIRPIAVDQPEDLVDKTRFFSFDSRGLAGLAQILTRKACRQQVHGWKRLSDVVTSPALGIPGNRASKTAAAGVQFSETKIVS